MASIPGPLLAVLEGKLLDNDAAIVAQHQVHASLRILTERRTNHTIAVKFSGQGPQALSTRHAHAGANNNHYLCKTTSLRQPITPQPQMYEIHTNTLRMHLYVRSFYFERCWTLLAFDCSNTARIFSQIMILCPIPTYKLCRFLGHSRSSRPTTAP